MKVIVKPGNTVMYKGAFYAPGESLELADLDAERLIKTGRVFNPEASQTADEQSATSVKVPSKAKASVQTQSPTKTESSGTEKE